MTETPKPRLRKSRALLPLGDQLPLWSERVRGAPNALARSALFTCASRTRRRFERAVIASVEGTTIQYTGRELRQDDLTVWLQIAHEARRHALGDQVELTARGLARAMGKHGGGKDINDMRECIARLREGTIWVHHADGSGYSGNLIMALEWSEAGSGDREKWKLYLDKKILALFQPDTYTLQDWEVRLQLSPAEQWLYGFFASHANPYAYKPETLHRLSGSMGKLESWAKTLERSLNGLVSKGLIQDWVKDARSGTVRIIHKPKQEALPSPEIM